MKKFVLSISVVLFSLGSSMAQQKQAIDNTTLSPFELLQGVWAVERNDMLPTHLNEEYRIFLQDSLFFGSPITHTFGNNSKEKDAQTYYYDDESKELVIYNASLKGAQYTVKSISQSQLIFSVPNAQLNNFIDLIYIKVAEK